MSRQKPVQTGFEFDLDELESVVTPLNHHIRNASDDSEHRAPGKTHDVALQRLRKYEVNRLWGRKRDDLAMEEDAEALLSGWSEQTKGMSHRRRWSGESSGWNAPRPDGDEQGHSSEAREMPSAQLNQGIQFQQFVRNERADIHEHKDTGTVASVDIQVGQPQKQFPTNIVSNAKYTIWTFLPKTLYHEFSFFLNIYFLLVALSQIIPDLRIGFISTYIVPLVCVLVITIGKEAIDDIARRRRDTEANSEVFTVLQFPDVSGARQSGVLAIPRQSRDIKVGDVLRLEKNQRVPADVVILQSCLTDSVDELTTNELSPAASAAPPCDTGESFIRTDQLDGETDWKLRLPSPLSQNLSLTELQRLRIKTGPPDKKLNEFVGTLEFRSNGSAYETHLGTQDDTRGINNEGEPFGYSRNNSVSAPLTIENTAWANTVMASNTITYCAVIYTGRQTRSALSVSPSRSKTGLLELEINNLTKTLCVMTLTLSIVLVIFQVFESSEKSPSPKRKPWYTAVMIYLILFSTIIPISLRVNLDLAKSVYAYFIEHDRGIPNTIVRTSTIPEDLGRVEYLLSDKTGTLTQNEMHVKKIHIGTVAYSGQAMEEVAACLDQTFFVGQDTVVQSSSTNKTFHENTARVVDLIISLALCHNVTPTTDQVNGQNVLSYQASSPDEIAIVKFTESIGLRLIYRDRETIALQSTTSNQVVIRAEIKHIFPFTSDSKRMGIIVLLSSDVLGITKANNELWFFQKGADTVMTSIVTANDWLDEETANMAREGLRTLVIARKRLTPSQYSDFNTAYTDATLALNERDSCIASVIKTHLEHDLELLGVTGVEDCLQKDVKPSLELLRNAGIKIWMLTGDKIETARCVAISARLVTRGQHIQTMAGLKSKHQAKHALDLIQNQTKSCLLIDGESLSVMLSNYTTDFIAIAVKLPAVIICRCSPIQKAEVAHLIRAHTRKRVCCIGDGGNDVSMIQAADVGIGIVGKEGRQASLAADFSIMQFCHLSKLLVWHGRNSYKRSAKLAQFIIHRGLIISVCQTVYNIAGHFNPEGLFKDWLLVGYATVYTMAPVFSLVLDCDIDEKLANLYPELYKELKSGKSLGYQSFFMWVLASVYQGIIIQGLAQLLVGEVDGKKMLSVSFTVLVLNELIMVAIAVSIWHRIMIGCIVGTAALYALSLPFLGSFFDLEYVASWSWVWKVMVVGAISLLPVWGGKVLWHVWKPPNYHKVGI